MIVLNSNKKSVKNVIYENTCCMSCESIFTKEKEPIEIYFSGKRRLILLCTNCYNQLVQLIEGDVSNDKNI